MRLCESEGKWVYLYRALDKHGDTDFYLSPTRNAKATKRFLCKALANLKNYPSLLKRDTAIQRRGPLPREMEWAAAVTNGASRASALTAAFRPETASLGGSKPSRGGTTRQIITQGLPFSATLSNVRYSRLPTKASVSSLTGIVGQRSYLFQSPICGGEPWRSRLDPSASLRKPRDRQ
jgi:DDE domain